MNAPFRQEQIDDAVRQAVRAHGEEPFRDHDPMTVAMAFVAANVGRDVTQEEVHEAIVRVTDAMQRDGNMANIIIDMAARHDIPLTSSVTVADIIACAVEAGDEEAIALQRTLA